MVNLAVNCQWLNTEKHIQTILFYSTNSSSQNMSAVSLTEAFKNAIAIEQKEDMAATESYLATYPPKKLALFGLAVVNLCISNMKSGLGGKTLIELSLDPAVSSPDDNINSGSVRVGDIVKVSKLASNNSDKTEKALELEAVVTKVASKMIVVAVDEDSSDEKLLNLYNNTGNDDIRVCIVKLANTVTYKRMLSSMNKLEEVRDGKLNAGFSSGIINTLLGNLKNVVAASKKKNLSFFDPNLNKSQQQAIKFAIEESPLTIIHGPPGTGKTYTLIEIIKQLSFNYNERVLVCGPSNISVDTILERLSTAFNEETTSASTTGKRKKKTAASTAQPEKLIRIGHPARLLISNLAHSLDVLSKTNYGGGGSTNDAKEVLRDVQKDIQDSLSKVKKCKRYSERRALWAELKILKKELREREKKVTQELLRGAKVILLTLYGAGSYELTSVYKNSEFSSENPFFDTIIIDEVSQSLEPQCWIPLVSHLGYKRLIIAGDNMQLPPTVKSKDKLALEFLKLKLEKSTDVLNIADLEYTMFDRLVRELDGDQYKKLLDTQYRMNTEIMKFPSDELYESKLKAHASVCDIKLVDLPEVKSTDDTKITCIWYDTQGGDFQERASDADDMPDMYAGGGSKYNDYEAQICVNHINDLLVAGVRPEHIGIISPYSAQVSLLKNILSDNETTNGIEISTVDGFQGREKEAIIVSLVRSNDNREVGFLRDRRRLNVAITRPKRHLCIVGDLELMQQSGVAFLKNWSEFVESNFEIRYPESS